MTSHTNSKKQPQQPPQQPPQTKTTTKKKKKNKKKSKTDPKLLPWIEARKRYRLSDTHVQMARSLGMKPGGQVLFDVYSLAAFAEREEQATCAPGLLDGFWSPAPYFGFLNTFRYEEDKVALDKYTIVEKKRVRVFYNWLQYFDRESLGAELKSCGLEVVEFLGDVAGSGFDPTGHEFAVIARKPGDGSASSGSATAPGTDDS